MTTRATTKSPARGRTAALAAVLSGTLLAAVVAMPAAAAPIARTTELISTPTGVLDPGSKDAFFAASSDDGSRVFFVSGGRLTSDDAESDRLDVFERWGGTTTLRSGATAIADPGSASVSFREASSDGSHVFFTTDQKLVADDGDVSRRDVYQHADGATTLISQPTGVADPDTADATFEGASSDGARVFFTTTQKLTPDDNDAGRFDVYERAGGTTTLLSAPTGVADPDTAHVSYGGASADGSRVFFTTTQKLTADDTDANRGDVYERSAGTTKLVSMGDGAPDTTSGVQYSSASRDGSRVVFYSTERLTVDDTDTGRSDVYERSGGTTRLVSAPAGVATPDSDLVSNVQMSQDGRRVFFMTPQRLTPDDNDTNRWDLYERGDGTTTLLSAPTGVADPDTADVPPGSLYGVSADGSRVLFTTTQKLTAADGDTGRADVYERSGGTTTLLSAPTGVADPDTANVALSGLSEDGSRSFFTTTQSLTMADGDTNRADVYERSEGTTTLLSTPTGLGDPDAGDAAFAGASADGAHVFFTTNEKLTAADSDAAYDTYEAVPSPAGPAPGGGTPEAPAPGGEAPGAGAGAADLAPAALSAYRLSPNVFRPASRGAAVARRRPIGTRVRYTLSEPAAVTFRVERAVRGRYVTLRGRMKHTGGAGPNRFRFSGRLRGRRLRPGAYRLRARAVDAAGNVSPLVRTGFRIVRR